MINTYLERSALTILEEMLPLQKDELKRLALKMAINSIQKQIPKKPNNYNDGFLYCESCGHPTLHSDKQESYCFVCGQAQDWSDNQ